MTRKEFIKQLKPFIKKLNQLELEYSQKTYDLEKEINKYFNRKDLEFFYCDGEFAGIGNLDRTMKLIHKHELER